MPEQRPWPISGSSGYTPSQLLGGNEAEPVMQENSDGSWTPSTPTPLSNSLDFEVTGTGHGPFEWEAWRGMDKVATGRARTRLGLQIGLLRARRKYGA